MTRCSSQLTASSASQSGPSADQKAGYTRYSSSARHQAPGLTPTMRVKTRVR
jgi:hypothetical protein